MDGSIDYIAKSISLLFDCCLEFGCHHTLLLSSDFNYVFERSLLCSPMIKNTVKTGILGVVIVISILIYFEKIYFVMVKLNFQHHYSSLQCHMILQKSF